MILRLLGPEGAIKIRMYIYGRPRGKEKERNVDTTEAGGALLQKATAVRTLSPKISSHPPKRCTSLRAKGLFIFAFCWCAHPFPFFVPKHVYSTIYYNTMHTLTQLVLHQPTGDHTLPCLFGALWAIKSEKVAHTHIQSATATRRIYMLPAIQPTFLVSPSIANTVATRQKVPVNV